MAEEICIWHHCSDVVGWDISNCCDSCHEDYDEYNYEMCHIEIDGKDYHVCCRCWDWFQKQETKVA